MYTVVEQTRTLFAIGIAYRPKMEICHIIGDTINYQTTRPVTFKNVLILQFSLK